MRKLMNQSFQIVFIILLGICICQSYAVELVTQQLTDNDSNDIFPQLSGAYAVWEWEDPNDGDTEIIFYDSEKTIQLTDNTTPDVNPQIFGKRVVWQGWDVNDGDWEIFFYNGCIVQQLTNDAFDDTYPKISDSLIIWEAWDGNDWEIKSAYVPVPAGIKVTPQSLNLKSKGKWITVHLKLPEGMTASQVNKSSLLLMNQVPVSKVRNGDTPRKLTLKFNREAVQSLLTLGPEVDIFFTGQLKDGTVIDASDTIKVINPSNR